MRLIAVVACLLLFACGGAAKPPLVVSDIVITAPMPGKHMSAGYLSFTNNTSVPIIISRVTSTEFEVVEIHESLLEDGVAKMRRIEALAIPAMSSVSLQRGGKHLMLMRPTATLDIVTLSFFNDDTLLLSVQSPVTRRIN